MNEQQNFWANVYAEKYIESNCQFDRAKGVDAWNMMLRELRPLDSILECGSNIGKNIDFLNEMMPASLKSIIEISQPAFKYVSSHYELDRAFNGSIEDADFDEESFDLVFTIGVLIHIHPDNLLKNLEKMYKLSSEYILMGEYFNRTPVMLEYQGLKNKLFKRDFGKIFIETFQVELLDVGFLWGHLYDKSGFDDITWWLFKKKLNCH